MTRELKFRVWKKDERTWANENYLFDNCLNVYSNDGTSIPEREEFQLVVQQYTGLKDKNGKEIYEGDIFKGSDYKWDALQFEDGQFQVNLIGARVFSLQELCCDIDYELPEVIGNIFENPELLKQ